MTSTFIDCDGVRLHVDDIGDDAGHPPIVMLHGFTGDGSTMRGLGELVSPRRLLLVDLVGHGRSDVPEDVGPYSMDRTVEQVGAVIEELAGGRADLVGYSFGGRVALSLLTARPDVVERAVLISATPGLATAEDRSARITADEALATSIEQNGLDQFVDRWMALPMWNSLRRALSVEEWEASRQQRLRSDPTGLANSLRGAGTGSMPPLHHRLVQIDVPVTLVTGGLDVKFTEINESMVRALPNASLSVIADTGHAPHLERPDAVAAELEAAFA